MVSKCLEGEGNRTDAKRMGKRIVGTGWDNDESVACADEWLCGGRDGSIAAYCDDDFYTSQERILDGFGDVSSGRFLTKGDLVVCF